MSDRELLELAAKAYGDPSVSAKAEGPFHTRVIGYCETMQCDVTTQWNPRADDGDALRLLAKIRGSIECVGGTVRAFTRDQRGFWISSERLVIGDRDEAGVMREAITKLAAEIGKAGAQ